MDLTWIPITGLTFIFLYMLHRAYKMYYYWDERGVPNLKAVPYFSLVNEVLICKKDVNTLIKGFYKGLAGQRLGGIMQLATPTIMVRDPDLVHQITVTDFTHFEDRNLPQNGTDLLNETLLVMTGERWRQARQKVSPSFSTGKMRTMFDTIKQYSDQATDYIKSKGKQDIESYDLLLKYCVGLSTDVWFSQKMDIFNPNSKESTVLLDACARFFIPSPASRLKLILSATLPKLKSSLKLNLIDKEVNNYFYNFVESLANFREEIHNRPNDFLQLMLNLKENEVKQNKSRQISDNAELKDKLMNEKLERDSEFGVFTDRFMASQSFVFLSGAIENLVVILKFALYELATNPQVQRKLQKEIDEVLSSNPFDYQGVAKMTYLDQVLHETIRLHPNTPTLFRACTKDYKVPDTDIIIKKGTPILLPIRELHRDPEYFDDPEAFYPDRFEDMGTIRKGTFLSFGAGPRMCIAFRFSNLAMKILLANILSKYNVVMSERTKMPIEMDCDAISQRAVGGLWYRYEERV